MRRIIIFGLLLIAIPVFAETAKLQTSDGTAVSSANPLPVTVISGGGGDGAPTDADYLVGTANGSLSAEIVAGTAPGGELGGTWASPTLDDTVTTTGWVMGTFTGTQLTMPTLIGDTSTTGDLNLQTTSGVGATGADMHFKVGNAGATEAMTILNSGNVGMGTTNPATSLDLVGASTFRNSTTWTASTGPAVTVTDTSTPDTAAFSCTNNSCTLGTSTNTSLFLVEQTGTRMTLHNNGNVGIGTTVPAAHFSVGTTSQFQVDSSGILTPGGYKSVDGTTGVTVTTCTGFKNGLCISGT